MTEEQNVLPGIDFSRKRASVFIHQSTVHALGHPRYVRILCNEKRKRLAVQVCAVKESGAIKVPNGRGKPRPFLLSSLLVQVQIWNICGWDRNGNYRIIGVVHPKQELVEFDLTKAALISDEMFSVSECPDPKRE